jgi:hypothetical protein
VLIEPGANRHRGWEKAWLTTVLQTPAVPDGRQPHQGRRTADCVVHASLHPPTLAAEAPVRTVCVTVAAASSLPILGRLT